MMPVFNPDYQLVYRKETTEQLYFQNVFFGTLVQLSEIEYTILGAYVEHGDYASTAAQFAAEFDFEPEFIPQLVDRAQSLDLLLTDDYLERKKKADNQHNGQFIEYLRYATYWISSLSLLKKLQIKAEFKGNFRFLRLLSLDFKDSWLERACTSRYGKAVLLLLGLVAVIMALFSIMQSGLAGLAPQRLLQIEPMGLPYFTFIVIGGLLGGTFLHELGHYVLYRHYGGQTNVIGLALTLGMFPALYVTTNSLYFWEKQYQRLLVTAAGLFVDFAQALVLLALLLRAPSPAVTYYSLVFLYLTAVRILANINPFIPGTDGYFLATDILNRPALYQSAAFATTEAIHHLRRFSIGRITAKQWAAFVYLTLSVLSITLYYSMLGASLLLSFMKRFY